MLCADNEHFLEYRQIVRQQIEEQLANFLVEAEHQQATPSTIDREMDRDASVNVIAS